MKEVTVIIVALLTTVMPSVVFSTGLVPCGGVGQEQCQTCHVVMLVDIVVDWLIAILSIVAAILIAYAGARMVISGGDVSAKETAKKIITNVIIGYALLLACWLLIDTGVKALLNDQVYGSWNQIRCVAQPQPRAADIEYIDLGDLGFSAGLYSLTRNVDGQFGPDSGPGTLGQCVIATTGPCSVEALQRAGFGRLAQDAARIVGQESGCNPNAESRTDTTTDGRTFSVGTWQINLAVHPLRCTSSTGQSINLNCPSAFQRTNQRNRFRVRMYQVVNESLYSQCVQAAKDPHCNNQIAARLANASGDMGDWACSAKKCGVQTRRNHLCPLP
jgi:hypothetical protein